MKVIHSLGTLSASREINGNRGFLLASGKGGYCSFFSLPTSRYHGFFFFDTKLMKMFRCIENIELVGHDGTDWVKNGFYFAERKKGDATERLEMPKGMNSLIYELDAENEIDVLLDCKEAYDNRVWGNYYDINEEDNCILVKFTKKTDLREDSSGGKTEFALYLAIKSDSDFLVKNNRWVERHYIDDEKRNSKPFSRFVYNALRLKGRKFVISASKSRKSALMESDFVFKNMDLLKQKNKDHFFSMLKSGTMKKIITNNIIPQEIKIAYISSANSLNNLVAGDKKNFGIFAGLPWFFQFWSRDSLISLKSLQNLSKSAAEKILLKYLDNINEDGRLANLAADNSPKAIGNADAAGWLFFRCSILVSRICRDKETINSIKKSMYWIKNSTMAGTERIRTYIKRCESLISKKENEYFKLLYTIEKALEKSIGGLIKRHTNDGMELNGKNETWMDTDFGDDGRKGARIELQALRLSMYRLAFELTLNHKYRILENILKTKVREKFWNGKTLADGLNDFTVRPNIFIAAYAYPELLLQKDWETCFENSLKSLWLEWGGLSTIDKNNKLFTQYNTGENTQSYHRGDSWFYLNNLAAIELNKVNSKKFKKYTEKIMSASTEDILWNDCVGCASELSSANGLDSAGCFNQAWSNAMYMELVDEVYK